jgi:hypothetical protein
MVTEYQVAQILGTPADKNKLEDKIKTLVGVRDNAALTATLNTSDELIDYLPVELEATVNDMRVGREKGGGKPIHDDVPLHAGKRVVERLKKETDRVTQGIVGGNGGTSAGVPRGEVTGVAIRMNNDERLLATVTASRDELKALAFDLRDAIRLVIGLKTNVPWREVPQSDVDGYVTEIRRLKSCQPGSLSSEELKKLAEKHRDQPARFTQGAE